MLQVKGMDKQVCVNLSAECGYPSICADPCKVFATPKHGAQGPAKPRRRSPSKSRPASALGSPLRSQKPAAHVDASSSRSDVASVPGVGVGADGVFSFGALLKGVDKNGAGCVMHALKREAPHHPEPFIPRLSTSITSTSINGLFILLVGLFSWSHSCPFVSLVSHITL